MSELGSGHRNFVPYIGTIILFLGFLGFICKPNIMKENTTLNEFLFYLYCAFCLAWAIYVLTS
ncbi:hypothetical protein DHC50_05430 [Arenibacter sp. A80]|nr:hypothetical protein [Arenibacter sp. A80]RFT57068.1 hypothetical protein D0S24_05430 [Arenibacter sp. P308M17]